MRFDTDGISTAFRRWQELSDAYAEQLVALRRREPGASAAVMRICRDLEQCQSELRPQPQDQAG